MELSLDVECYPNYFLALLRTEGGKYKAFEQFGDEKASVEERQKLFDILHADGVTTYGFNSTHYDNPMTVAFMAGATCSELKTISDDIITNNLKFWTVMAKYGIAEAKWDNVDLIEVAPGKASLKIYAGRMHDPEMQDLPYPPDQELTEEEMEEVYRYCKKDLRKTWNLRLALKNQLTLREELTMQYGIDMRSHSDAQIAEKVLGAEYQRLEGSWPHKARVNYKSFYYEPPKYIKFLTPMMQEAFETICNSEMVIKSTGHVDMPKAIDKLQIKIGNMDYKVGIGGLHSKEKEVSHYSDDDFLLIDRDVESYYPRMIINMGVSPAAYGSVFLEVYGDVLNRRLEAKHAGNSSVSDTLKITLNGTFGKLANRYSALYSPIDMVRTTLTGQLSLLMLIEMMELCGVEVVSANTDGIVFKCPRDDKDKVDLIISKWEKRTGLKTEETLYRSLHSRDVNNYIAVKHDGGTKRKGVFGKPGLSKNPQNTICSDAAAAYLEQGTSVEETILNCKDITKFVTVRTVNGGAQKDGHLIGKAIRWYYAKGVEGEINYVTTGNVVPRSEGAKPLMDLPDDFPDDVDYDWYIKEAEEILMGVGAIERPYVEKIPRKNSKAWKELVEAGKIVEGKKGKWEWK